MYEIAYSQDYLAHHGILGQKWGVRRYQNEDGSLTAAGKKRQRKLNGKELNDTINRSRNHSNDGLPSAKEVWDTSETMKKFKDMTKNDYLKRNKIYNDAGNDELKIYNYGKKFEDLMKEKASQLVYTKEDVNTVMKLVERADWDEINSDTYHNVAWLYWH